MKARFSPQVIGELRHRIISHNEALQNAGSGASREASLIKLSTLKGLYKRWYGGRDDPHRHALQKIDEHLASLRQDVLSKAEEARDERGRWKAGVRAEVYAGRGRAKPPAGSSGGSAPPSGGQKGFYADVAKPSDHRALAQENAGYDAAQTQVIPETRFSVFGPPIAGAATIAYGIHTGATADWHGSRIDRAQTRAAGYLGTKAGQVVGQAAGASIRGSALAARGVIGGVNRLAHTTYPRPHPDAGKTAIRGGALAGRKIGEKVGRGLSRAQIMAFNGPAILARQGAQRIMGSSLKGRIGARSVGGVVGGLVIGSLVAPKAYQLATDLGPYLDAMFPRRVRKMDLPLFDAPDVLAKQYELMNDDLAKANVGAALRALGAATRGLGGKAARLVATLRPSIASHAAGPGVVSAPGSIGGAAAHNVFGQYGAKPPKPGQFTVNRHLASRLIEIAKPTASLGILGAGVGAISGAAGVGVHDYLFANKHPRDPKGRFATKAKTAKLGAKVGAAVGLGLGLAIGLANARRGHGALLAQAVKRLGDAAPAMQLEAQKEARTIHARAFVAKKANQAKLKDFSVNPADVTDAHVKNSLEAHAADVWAKTHGQALRQGPVQWYTAQLDEALNTSAFRQMKDVVDPVTKQKTPLLNKLTGKSISGPAGLLQDLDVDKLNPAQRVIWDNHLQRHTDAVDALKALYAERSGKTLGLETLLGSKTEESHKLEADLKGMRDAASELENNDAPFQTIKKFAKDRLGHDIQARTRVDALNELQVHIDKVWEPAAEARSYALQEEIKQLQIDVDASRRLSAQDVLDTEMMAVTNPFSKKPPFLQTMPDFDKAKQAAGEAASKSFIAESDAHAKEAKEHLESLITARHKALEGGIPSASLPTRAFRHVAPKLAAWMSRTAEDVAALSEANRSAMTGTQKQVYDAIHANKDPKQAALSIKKMKDGAYAYGKSASSFVFRNWKSISNLVGFAGLIGAADISAPPGKRLNWNPKTWALPTKGIEHEIDYPNPISKPHEAVIGITYRDRNNQRRFLAGSYITGADGTHTNIPFGANADLVRQQVRSNQQGGGGGGNQQNRPAPIPVKNRGAIDAAINRFRNSDIVQVGPPGALFRQLGTSANGGVEAKDVADSFWDTHLKRLQDNKISQTTNRPNDYWNALNTLFDEHTTQLLNQTQRANLLVGEGARRGIFGGGDMGAFRANDKPRIIRQITAMLRANNGAQTEPQLRQLRRVAYVLGEHFKLSAGETQGIYNELDRHYKASTGKDAPNHTANSNNPPQSDLAGSLARAREVEDDAITQYPANQRFEDYVTDNALRNHVRAVYQQEVSRRRQAAGSASLDEDQLHEDAAKDTLDGLQWVVKKSAPSDGLRKFLAWDKKPAAPISPIHGSTPTTPPIAGARAKPGLLGRAATRLDVSHQLSQGATYGLSQAAWEGAKALTDRFIPGGGALRSTARFALPAAASYAGGVTYGPRLGAGAGHALGDTTQRSRLAPRSEGEAGVRSIGGTAAQFAGMHATDVGMKVGIKALPGALGREVASVPGAIAGKIGGAARGIGNVAGKIGGAASRMFGGGAARATARGVARAAATGGAETLGAELGGGLGTAAGAVAGGIADPLGGEVAGGLGGKIIGTAIGAGAGWLADEGIGMLYRHLGSYGKHIPAMAAKSLGHKPAGLRV